MKLKFIWSMCVGLILITLSANAREGVRLKKAIQFSLLKQIKILNEKLGTIFNADVFNTEVSQISAIAEIHKGKTSATIYQVDIYDVHDHYLADPLSSFWIYVKANKIMAIIYREDILKTLTVEVFIT